MSYSLDTHLDHLYTQRALEHARHFAVEIGPRPSCGEGERRAAEYAAQTLRELGLNDVRLETFESGTSTYRPFAVAFALALAASAAAAVLKTKRAHRWAAACNALSAFGFAREAALQTNWTRRFSPSGQSQNAIGIVPSKNQSRRIIVLYGHLDTHRTPIFYSNATWLKCFSNLVGMGFLSLLAGSIGHFWRPQSTLGRAFHRAAMTAGSAMQLFSFVLTLHADRTPHTAGANDNASGAATVLALAERLKQHSLRNCEVWIVNNGCEELGCYGINALLERHQSTLKDAWFLDLDMIGIGVPTLLEKEGLLRPTRPDEALLQTARDVAQKHPDLLGAPDVPIAHSGGAYTDSGMVASRGFAGLTIDSQLPPSHHTASRMGYWHQSDDRFEHLEGECLRRAHAFTWYLMQELDEQAAKEAKVL